VIIGTGMVVVLIAMVAVVIVVPAIATVRPFFCVRDVTGSRRRKSQ
jgi:hypothetical protein